MTTPLLRPSAVIDTNVVLDWLVFRDPGCNALAAAVEAGTLHWLLTPAMKQEYERVFRRSTFARWHRRSIDAVSRWARMAAPPCWRGTDRQLRCSDPDDQKFIDLALASNARWLFTRDKALLRMARRAALRGSGVLTPAAWAALPPDQRVLM